MSQTTNDWFYSDQGAQRGPVSFETLRAMAATGQLLPQSLVWREGMTNWFPASSVDGLFAGIAGVEVPPPYAGTVMGGPIPMAYYGGGAPVGEYVGFWWRVLAYLIDYIITYIAAFAIAFGFGLIIGLAMGGTNQAQDIAGAFGALIGTIVAWLYFAVMESSTQQATLGKLAIGVRVTDLNGNRISFGRATGRYFAKILSGLTICVGFMMVGFTDRKQGLHDMVASTLVLRGRPLK